MRLNDVPVAYKIYAASALFALSVLFVQLFLIVNIQESSAIIEEQTTYVDVQMEAVDSQNTQLIQQNKLLKNLEISNGISHDFSEMRYWLYDLSVSWLNESEENAGSSRDHMLAKLTKFQTIDASLANELKGNVILYEEKMLAAVDAYVDENRVLGNSRLSQARDIGTSIEQRLNNYLTQAHTATQSSGDSVNQASEAVGVAGEQLRDAAQRVNKTNQGLLVLSFIMLVVVAVIGVAFSLLLRRAIIPALKGMKSAIEDIDRDSDLTGRIPVGGKVEFGTTASAINHMLGQFQNIVSLVLEATNTLDNSVSQTAASMSNTRSSVNRQRSETEQVATAINEMSATINEVAKNASDAAGTAKQADDAAIEGKQVVDATLRLPARQNSKRSLPKRLIRKLLILVILPTKHRWMLTKLPPPVPI